MTATDPPPPAAPDTPPVPTSRMSWLIGIYLVLGLAGVSLYVAAGVLGWEFRTTHRDRVPGSVRSSPGGYRAYHFWHAGYRGGK